MASSLTNHDVIEQLDSSYNKKWLGRITHVDVSQQVKNPTPKYLQFIYLSKQDDGINNYESTVFKTLYKNNRTQAQTLHLIHG